MIYEIGNENLEINDNFIEILELIVQQIHYELNYTKKDKILSYAH